MKAWLVTLPLLLAAAPPPPVDQEAETRAIAKGFIERQFVRGDVAGAKAQYFAPDFVQHNPEIASGLTGDTKFFEARRQREPDKYRPVAEWRNTNDRLLVQGKYFALHHHLFAGPADKGRVFVDLWRVEHGKVVEHWDIIQPVTGEPLNANTMWSDKQPARRREPSAEAAVRDYLRIGIDRNDPRGAAERYIADDFVQHSPHIADGKAALLAYFAKRAATPTPPRSSTVTHILADADLVLVTRHVTRGAGDKGVMYADLFRVRRGLIVEHWDVIEEVPPTSVNGNTMW